MQSMTGHAQKTIDNEFAEINIQIKSLNHRFRDIKWKVPSLLAMYEIQARKIIEQYFKRGSFDVYVYLKFKDKYSSSLSIDVNKVNNFLNQFEKCKLAFTPQIELTQFLRQEFLQENSQEFQNNIGEDVIKGISDCCELLQKERVEEGSKIRTLLLKSVNELIAGVEKINSHKNNTLDIKKKKIEDRLSEISSMKNVIDESRLAQEFVYWGQKYDIQEEVDRFLMHCEKLDFNLKNGSQKNEKGKELEFLLQELGREINTLSNKSDNVQISHEGVSIKCILEAMREQVLNIE